MRPTNASDCEVLRKMWRSNGSIIEPNFNDDRSFAGCAASPASSADHVRSTVITRRTLHRLWDTTHVGSRFMSCLRQSSRRYARVRITDVPPSLGVLPTRVRTDPYHRRNL